MSAAAPAAGFNPHGLAAPGTAPALVNLVPVAPIPPGVPAPAAPAVPPAGAAAPFAAVHIPAAAAAPAGAAPAAAAENRSSCCENFWITVVIILAIAVVLGIIALPATLLVLFAGATIAQAIGAEIGALVIMGLILNGLTQPSRAQRWDGAHRAYV